MKSTLLIVLIVFAVLRLIDFSAMSVLDYMVIACAFGWIVSEIYKQFRKRG